MTVPLLPADELPELNARRPLAPDAPPFAARTATIPLLVCVPSPDATPSPPPVATVLRPDWRLNAPPAPLVPLPALIPTPPDRPAVAAPDPTRSSPLFPPLDEPELNAS